MPRVKCLWNGKAYYDGSLFTVNIQKIDIAIWHYTSRFVERAYLKSQKRK